MTQAGGTADRALVGHQRDTDPTNHIVDSIRKPVHELLEMFHLQIPQTDYGTPSAGIR